MKLTVDKQKARLAVLEHNSSLASESTSHQYNDGTRSTAGAHLGGVSHGDGTLLLDNVLSGVVLTLHALGLRRGLILESEFLQINKATYSTSLSRVNIKGQ